MIIHFNKVLLSCDCFNEFILIILFRRLTSVLYGLFIVLYICTHTHKNNNDNFEKRVGQTELERWVYPRWTDRKTKRPKGGLAARNSRSHFHTAGVPASGQGQSGGGGRANKIKHALTN